MSPDQFYASLQWVWLFANEHFEVARHIPFWNVTNFIKYLFINKKLISASRLINMYYVFMLYYVLTTVVLFLLTEKTLKPMGNWGRNSNNNIQKRHSPDRQLNCLRLKGILLLSKPNSLYYLSISKLSNHLLKLVIRYTSTSNY